MRLTDFKINKAIILFLLIVFSFVIRIIWIDKYPPAPYSDEIDQAYNAYSILKTGKDEHGSFLPVSFRSFGDWKPPLQTYLMIPSIAIYGLNVQALRFPNIIIGVLSVLMSYLLVKELIPENRKKSKIAILTAFFISVSPWHLHQSRSAMLVIIALFFTQSGLYFFLKFLKNKYYLYLSVTAFVLATYSYYGMRLIIPLLCIYLFIRYKNHLLNDKKFFAVNFTLALLLVLPLFSAYLREPNVLLGRAKSVSVFYDMGTKLKLWELQTQDGVKGLSSTLSHFFHNKPYMYSLDISRRFSEHFDGQFLFTIGDLSSPFLIPNMGVLYLLDGVFIIIGILMLFKSKENNNNLIFVWLVLSVLPASLTFLTPTQNRTFNAVFIFSLFTAYGLVYLLRLKLVKTLVLVLVLAYSFSFNLYLNNYYKVLPLNYSGEWLYGFREVVDYINQNNNFSKVIFLPKTGMSYIYVLFYNQYPPENYQKQAKHLYEEDEVGFEHVSSFDKYSFLRKEKSWEILSHQMESGELYIGRDDEIPDEFTKTKILYPNGKVAFKISYLE